MLYKIGYVLFWDICIVLIIINIENEILLFYLEEYLELLYCVFFYGGSFNGI